MSMLTEIMVCLSWAIFQPLYHMVKRLVLKSIKIFINKLTVTFLCKVHGLKVKK